MLNFLKPICLLSLKFNGSGFGNLLKPGDLSEVKGKSFCSPSAFKSEPCALIESCLLGLCVAFLDGSISF